MILGAPEKTDPSFALIENIPIHTQLIHKPLPDYYTQTVVPCWFTVMRYKLQPCNSRAHKP